MSGPIVRKYGFPNHEAIFGKKEIEHGLDNSAPSPDAAPAKAAKTEGTTKKKSASRKPKKSAD